MSRISCGPCIVLICHVIYRLAAVGLVIRTRLEPDRPTQISALSHNSFAIRDKLTKRPASVSSDVKWE